MRQSLASSAGAHKSAIVSICICTAHAFFFYAQLSGLDTECGPNPPEGPGPCAQYTPIKPGGLMQAALDVHMDYDAAGVLKTGLETLTQEDCFNKGKYVECKEGRSTPSTEICSILECRGLEFKDLLLHISYFYSIDHLWSQPGWRPDEKPTGVYPGRTAAGMLFFWSFLWPHIKLSLLHLFFYLPVTDGLRRNVNYWLAFWGKWSLADVLVMAAVLALFDLNAEMSLVTFWQHLDPDFLQLCDAVCLSGFNQSISGIDFSNHSAPLPPSNCSSGCSLARVALEHGVTPQSLPHSDLHINLRMEGLEAMYAFCLAVLISLSTGVWIDTLDDALRDERRDERKRHGLDDISLNGPRDVMTCTPLPPIVTHERSEGTASLGTSLGASSFGSSPTDGAASLESSLQSSYGGCSSRDLSQSSSSPMRAMRAGLLNGASGGGGGDGADPPLVVLAGGARHPSQDKCALVVHVLLVLAQLVLVVGSFTLPAFERIVEGSVSKLLLDAGIDFTAYISLWSLPAMVASTGGLNYFMAATFTVFIILAPVARALSLLALLILPMRPATARRLYINSRRIVSYTALDVMLIATPLIGAAFGPMSEILLNDQTFAPCAMLDHIYGTGDICMRIDVLPTTGYWFNVAAIVAYLLSGFDGSPTAKFIHRRLYPHDSNPPPSLKC